jgi:hypothetical protein
MQVLFLQSHSTCFGRKRPKHVEWRCRNKTCIVLHQVGVSFDGTVCCIPLDSANMKCIGTVCLRTLCLFVLLFCHEIGGNGLTKKKYWPWELLNCKWPVWSRCWEEDAVQPSPSLGTEPRLRSHPALSCSIRWLQYPGYDGKLCNCRSQPVGSSLVAKDGAAAPVPSLPKFDVKQSAQWNKPIYTLRSICGSERRCQCVTERYCVRREKWWHADWMMLGEGGSHKLRDWITPWVHSVSLFCLLQTTLSHLTIYERQFLLNERWCSRL